MTDQKIQHRYQVLLLYEQKLIGPKEASQLIGVSERQFFRILNKFRRSERKIESLKFKSHPAWNKTSEDIEKIILRLNKDYPEALNSHFCWLAWDLYGIEIKSATVRNILLRNNVYVPFSQRKQRLYKKFQATHFGALIQLDTKDGYWLKGYPMLHLILALDDASRTILSGGFYESDSTLNNMIVIKEVIKKYGVPCLFYTDNDSKFKVIRHGQSYYQTYKKEVLEGEALTEIRRALMEVGSGLITHLPYQPQSKGKVEKIFRFIEDCFLKHQKAKDLKELNQAFQRWISWYDKRDHRSLGICPEKTRKKLIQEKKIAFRPLKKDLDAIFALKRERKPNKYNIFHYQGKEYQLPQDKIIYPGKVELRITPDQKILVFNQEKELIATLKS